MVLSDDGAAEEVKGTEGRAVNGGGVAWLSGKSLQMGGEDETIGTGTHERKWEKQGKNNSRWRQKSGELGRWCRWVPIRCRRSI